MIINKEKVINQLENIREHCMDMAKGNKVNGELDKEDIWYQDTVALDIAIRELKKKAPRDCSPKGAIRKIINYIIPHWRKKNEDK